VDEYGGVALGPEHCYQLRLKVIARQTLLAAEPIEKAIAARDNQKKKKKRIKTEDTKSKENVKKKANRNRGKLGKWVRDKQTKQKQIYN